MDTHVHKHSQFAPLHSTDAPSFCKREKRPQKFDLGKDQWIVAEKPSQRANRRVGDEWERNHVRPLHDSRRTLTLCKNAGGLSHFNKVSIWIAHVTANLTHAVLWLSQKFRSSCLPFAVDRVDIGDADIQSTGQHV